MEEASETSSANAVSNATIELPGFASGSEAVRRLSQMGLAKQAVLTLFIDRTSKGEGIFIPKLEVLKWFCYFKTKHQPNEVMDGARDCR